MTRHRAVVFDLFGTLTSWEREASRHALVDELATLLGAIPEDLRREMRASFTDRATGRTGGTRSTITYLARRLGLRLNEVALERAVQSRLEHERFIVEPSPDALDMLASVRARGCRVGILSDCTSEIVEMWPTLPYAAYVDAAVLSYDMGVRKPAPAMYAAIAKALDVAPSECLYIGDGASNELSGAITAGMTAVMLDGCADTSLQYDRDETWDGPHITDLIEVHQILDGRPTPTAP